MHNPCSFERAKREINTITMDRKVRLDGIPTDWHLQQILGKRFCSSATKLNIKMGGGLESLVSDDNPDSTSISDIRSPLEVG